jgi:hypothetical protein
MNEPTHPARAGREARRLFDAACSTMFATACRSLLPCGSRPGAPDFFFVSTR